MTLKVPRQNDISAFVTADDRFCAARKAEIRVNVCGKAGFCAKPIASIPDEQ